METLITERLILREWKEIIKLLDNKVVTILYYCMFKSDYIERNQQVSLQHNIFSPQQKGGDTGLEVLEIINKDYICMEACMFILFTIWI